MPEVYAIDGIVPVVDPDAYVHPTAILIGDVIVGPGCYVAPGASLRGDLGQIRMAEGANIQDNCCAHCFAGGETVIGPDASVGHGAVLHGCRVEAGALVGMNAVVMDGAVVGAGAIVAALAFVRAGFEVPPRAIVAGAPARVLRAIAPEEAAWMAAATGDYHDIRRRSVAALEAVDALAHAETEGPRLKVAGAKPLYRTRS